jgi:hypothetical protein
MLRIRAVLVVSLAASACLPSNFFDITSTLDPGDVTETGTGTEAPAAASTGEEPLPTTTDEPGTTAEPGTTTGTTGTTAGDTTADLPPGEPQAFDPAFDPDPLTAPGAIIVSVHTENADAVTLEVDGGPALALDPGPNGFTTTLFYYSSQDNGEHLAVFTPSFDGQTGDPLPAMFTVAMPDGGGEVFWEAAPTLGKGHIAAVAVLPDGAVAEFGTLIDGTPRCYIRQRTPAGDWTMPDDVQIFPDTPCKAIDLGVSPDGALYMLADREGMQDLSWWLGRSQKFGAPPTNLRWGSPGEKAYALAMHPKKAAVCGTQPAAKGDIQATAWVYGFDDPGSTLTFNYKIGMVAETYQETPRDCVYRGEVLVFAGDVHGKHAPEDPNLPPLDRLFILESDPNLSNPVWTIDGAPKDLIQSSARTLTIDGEGRTIIGNYVCGSPCTITNSEIRVYEPGGALTWLMPLAPTVGLPEDLAWSPAGYAVLVTAADLGNWNSSYFVQAWKPLNYPAVWSYTKNVALTLHIATTVAIGPFGQVYTGGIGSNGYPAVAFIHP